MNKNLRQLFSLESGDEEEENSNIGSNKNLDQEPPSSGISEKDEEEIATSARQRGLKEAGKASGKLSSLSSHLDSLYQDHVDEIRRRQGGQEEAKKPYLNQIERLKTEKSEKESEKEKVDKKIERNKEKVSDLKNEIRQIKENPDEILGKAIDSNAKMSFGIGIIIILVLTFYLILFYSSASFSAFFREFETGVEVTQTIFDPKAFVKAFENILSGLFISTIPIVFLALGYLIHKFNENKKDYWRFLKTAALIIITFLFDALLAYEIEKKLYEATKTINDPSFNAEIAAVSPEFWIIIFAGFVVYIVWGLVFSFTMNEYANIDAIKRATEKRTEEVREVNNQIENDKNEADEIQRKIEAINAKIEQIRNIIERTVFISPKEYRLMHTHFMKGWITFMNVSECSEEDIEEANNIADRKMKEFLEPFDKNDNNASN